MKRNILNEKLMTHKLRLQLQANQPSNYWCRFGALV